MKKTYVTAFITGVLVGLLSDVASVKLGVNV